MLFVAVVPGRVISPLFQCHSLGGARGSGGQRGGVPYDAGLSVPHGFPDRCPCPPRAGGRAEGPWVSALLGVHQGLRVWEVLCQELQKSLRKGESKSCVLWNYSYSWGPMIVEDQNSAGLWGRNFVGHWLVTLQCKTIHYFVKCLLGGKILGYV